MIKVALLDHTFSTGDRNDFNSLIEKRVVQESLTKPLFLAHHNLHSLYILPKCEQFRSYYNCADHIWLDGMPVVMMLKILGYPVKSNFRLTFLDWQKSLFGLADAHKYRVFLLGGNSSIIEKAASNLALRYPSIKFAFHHGYFGTDESSQVIAKIREMNTDILIVGMGMPIQEQWIHDNRSHLTAKVILPVGGYFDYVAGNTYTPPRWAGKYGLEWLFRLGSAPLRLGYRYLVEPWPVLVRFLWYFVREKSSHRALR